ncbi:MAG: glycosyltransferase [Kiritimatiellae bacterium]|nr:glycosyltransferase [Kiritimatiellia bacterium]
MRVCMVTQGVSPHQIPFARRVVSKVGDGSFLYVSVSANNQERDSLGWRQRRYPWVREPRLDQQAQPEADRWMRAADVLLTSVREIAVFRERCAAGKLTFYLSERWFKPPIGKLRLCAPTLFDMTRKFKRVARDAYLHYLPIGPYAARDMMAVSPFTGRMWRWGYFVEPSSAGASPRALASTDAKSALRVLWAGRFLDWKHADHMVDAFAAYAATGRKGRLTLLGCGNEELALRRRVYHAGVGDSVTFLAPIPMEEVRQEMRENDVFAATSNGYEGWGAVVSEAMEEGCAVIATRESGAGASMIRHGENGMLFRAGRVKELTACLCKLHDHAVLRARLAASGQETMRHLWGAQVAADRFVAVADALLRGAGTPDFSQGPMSVVSGREKTWAV